MNVINSILKNQIEKISLNKEAVDKIEIISKEFCQQLEKSIKKNKIDAEVFVGGSLAKKTMIRTDEDLYDVDIFVRFNKKHKNISDLLEKVLDNKFKRIHGSRDYFQKKVNNIILEVIPVIRIENHDEADNITDLSYFHVNYVLNKIRKNPELSNEIKIAKAFCHGNDCYGAESYIRGFSGYALEILIIHYKSFLKFIEAIADSNDKIVIDIEKMYENKKQVLIELNESKLISPIVLVDPTFKDRNALSSLSDETFEKFKKSCVDFLAKPSEEFFKKKNVMEDFAGLKNVKKIMIKTSKQAGDIAGTKSKKFFNFLCNQIKRDFDIKKSGFEYNELKNLAFAYFIVENKKSEIVKGPAITMIDNLKQFRKKHGINAFVKNHVAYAKVEHSIGFEKFIKSFVNKDKKIIKSMGIKEVKLEK